MSKKCLFHKKPFLRAGRILFILVATCCVYPSHAQFIELSDQTYQPLLGEGYEKLWRGYKDPAWPSGWKVEYGVLSRVGGGDDLITVEKFADFELELEWKISSGGNSGVMYRVSTGDKAAYFSGPEFQILDDAAHHDGKVASTSAGALYALYAPSEQAVLPAGEWNHSRIVVRGNHIEHWLNGKQIVSAEIGSEDWQRQLKKSKFADWPKFAKNREGHIALQDHGNPVWYQDIRIRRLQAE